jgi:hypothetical protein
MAKAAFTEALVTQLLERMCKDAIRLGIEVNYRVNVYQSESGPRAIVSMTVAPKSVARQEAAKG